MYTLHSVSTTITSMSINRALHPPQKFFHVPFSTSFPFYIPPVAYTNTQPARAYSTTQNENNSNKLSHVTEDGSARMVDVSDKYDTKREATARGFVKLNYETSDLIKDATVKKGDVLSVAQLAGIMGAKKTPELIPLCHNIPLTNVAVDVILNYQEKQIEIEATVRSEGKTGAEMEALTAVSVAALTVYDMCKAVSRDIIISDISLISKSGGKSGNFTKRPIVVQEPHRKGAKPLDLTEIRVGII